MTNAALVTVVCALPSEADAVIDQWRLPARRERPFRVHGDDHLRVVISGVGSHACAAAVGYAAGLREARANDIWLNLGIAGHGSAPLGTPMLATRISHHGRDSAWYPSLLFMPPCITSELITYDYAVSDYPPGACCDMEAAGFMAATSRIAAGDLVQVMKVISDNAEHGIAGIERKRVHALMQDALPRVVTLVEALRAVASQLPTIAVDELAQGFLSRWHFSHTQTTQLRQLLHRLTLLSVSAPPDGTSFAACSSAAAVLAQLRATVDALPLPTHIAP